MNRHAVVWALFALASGLAGCVNTGALPSPKNLVPVTSASSFTLTQPVTYDFSNAFGDRVKHIVSPGLYTALLEGADGIYYLGPGECLRYEASGTSFSAEGAASTQPCGIFLPFEQNAAPRVFFRFKTAESVKGDPNYRDVTFTAGPVVGAIVSYGAAEMMKTNINFDFPQPPPDQLQQAMGPVQH